MPSWNWNRLRPAYYKIREVAPSTTARALWAWRRRRAPDIRLIEGLVREGDNVIDIGANWGLYAKNLAARVGPQGKVYAFEPSVDVLPTLTRLARRCPNMTVFDRALSDQRVTSQLHVPIVEGRPVTGLASLVVPRGAADYAVVQVATERLDDVIDAELPIHFIKCDVEGHELSVMAGADMLLRHWMPTVLVEVEQRHLAVGTVDDFFGHMAGLGYCGFAIRPDGLAPIESFDVERDQLRYISDEPASYGMSEGYVGDFLFVRSPRDVAHLEIAT
jgi:FkbM family methyltransferase